MQNDEWRKASKELQKLHFCHSCQQNTMQQKNNTLKQNHLEILPIYHSEIRWDFSDLNFPKQYKKGNNYNMLMHVEQQVFLQWSAEFEKYICI